MVVPAETRATESPESSPPPRPAVRPWARDGVLADVLAAAVAGLLVLAACVVIVWWHWYPEKTIYAWSPPIFGYVHWHVGWGTPVALLVAAAVVWRGPQLAARLPWGRLRGLAYLVAVGWAFSLALTETWQRGVADRLSGSNQYLWDLPATTNISTLISGFASHILDFHPGSWVTQVAGHPPGALLVFVALDRAGLTGSTWASIVCVLISCTTVLTVPATLKVLGCSSSAAFGASGDAADAEGGARGDELARAAVPFLALFPGALWFTSGDGLFAGVTAATLLLLAVGARRARGALGVVLCLVAGLLLGGALFLSYGFVLLAPLALAVCVLAAGWRGAWRPVVLAGIGAIVVVIGFALAGFSWLDGYHLVVARYYQGVGFTRPYDYWVWADLAALAVCAGPAAAPTLRRAGLGALQAVGGRLGIPPFGGGVGGAGRSQLAAERSLGAAGRGTLVGERRFLSTGRGRWRPEPGFWPVAGMVLAAAVAIALADESGLSKAEVERIWLPFAVWLTAGAGLLPQVSRRWWLAAQALTALLVAHLVMTFW